MPITREGQFLITHDLDRDNVPSLGMESSQLAACIAEAKARHFVRVFGSPCFGFKEDTLDFLEELPWLSKIWFWDIHLQNIEGLYSLDKLKFFGVHDKRPPVDFALLPHLETIVWIFNRKDSNIASLSALKALHLWHYNPKAKNFDGLTLPSNLEKLEITWANPASVESLPVLPNLRRIEFHRCRNLTSLSGLNQVTPLLEEIIVTTANRVLDSESLLNLPHLKLAIVNGKRIKG